MENPSNGGLKLPPINFTKLFINGQFVDYVSGKTFTTCDPRTGEAIAAVAEGDTADLDLAVKAAREAFDHGKWPRISAHERGRLMNKFADLVEQHIDELASLDSLDARKLLSDGIEIDLPHCIHILSYCAGAADKIHGETLRLGGEFQGYTLREPIGVVGHIIPWNFPSTMFFLKVSPALAAGCTMVVKPAEQTPLSALFYAHLAKQASNRTYNLFGFKLQKNTIFPIAAGWNSRRSDQRRERIRRHRRRGTQLSHGRRPDQLHRIHGDRPESDGSRGEEQSEVSVTGTGRQVAAHHLRRRRPRHGVGLALLAVFHNKGEICAAGSRVYVQEAIYDEFVNKAAEAAKNRKVGDPSDPTVQQGPQVDKRQFEKVLKYIELGKEEGATLVAGGKRCGEVGYFIEPTIFTDVKEDMKIFQDEIFGPVMSLMKFK